MVNDPDHIHHTRWVRDERHDPMSDIAQHFAGKRKALLQLTTPTDEEAVSFYAHLGGAFRGQLIATYNELRAKPMNAKAGPLDAKWVEGIAIRAEEVLYSTFDEDGLPANWDAFAKQLRARSLMRLDARFKDDSTLGPEEQRVVLYALIAIIGKACDEVRGISPGTNAIER